MKSFAILALTVCLCSFFATAQDSTQVAYQEYFHSKKADSAMHAWTLVNSQGPKLAQVPRIVRSPRGIRLLGIFGSQDTLELALNKLPKHSTVMVSVAFHIIGAWDGEVDKDRFIFMADGKPHIDATFSNTTSQQSWPKLSPNNLYPARATARNSNMLAYPSRIEDVYVGPMDATYEATLIFPHSSSKVDLQFTADLNNIIAGAETKKWGLEHIVVSVTSDSAIQAPSQSSSMVAYGLDNIKDAREIAEFVQDEDFPGLKAGSDFERGLHITVNKAECHSCGDFCLWYSYRFYTDGWVNVWNNKPAKGKSTYSVQLTPEELDSVRIAIAECLQAEISKEYHDADYEFAHPELTHCALWIKLGKREGHTEVYAGEPESIKQLMSLMLRILARYGWQPIPG